MGREEKGLFSVTFPAPPPIPSPGALLCTAAIAASPYRARMAWLHRFHRTPATCSGAPSLQTPRPSPLLPPPLSPLSSSSSPCPESHTNAHTHTHTGDTKTGARVHVPRSQRPRSRKQHLRRGGPHPPSAKRHTHTQPWRCSSLVLPRCPHVCLSLSYGALFCFSCVCVCVCARSTQVEVVLPQTHTQRPIHGACPSASVCACASPPTSALLLLLLRTRLRHAPGRCPSCAPPSLRLCPCLTRVFSSCFSSSSLRSASLAVAGVPLRSVY